MSKKKSGEPRKPVNLMEALKKSLEHPGHDREDTMSDQTERDTPPRLRVAWNEDTDVLRRERDEARAEITRLKGERA